MAYFGVTAGQTAQLALKKIFFGLFLNPSSTNFFLNFTSVPVHLLLDSKIAPPSCII